MAADSARIALAIAILKTKPAALSIADYIHLLRAHSHPHSPSTLRRQVDSIEFWRERASAESARVRELQARVRELEEEREGEEAQAALKRKKKEKKKKGDWEVLRIASGGYFETHGREGIHALVSALRTLYFASSAPEIAGSITATCVALLNLIRALTSGKPLPPPQPPTSDRTAPGLKAANEARDTKSVASAVEAALSRLLTSLPRLAGLGEKSYTVQATCSIIEVLAGLMSCIHANSRALVSNVIAHSLPMGTTVKYVEKMEIKDLRPGICTAIAKALTSLNPESGHEGNVLEGVMRFLLDASGSILSSSCAGGGARGAGDEKWQLEAAAVDETSWYLMRILQAVMPLYNCLNEGALGRKGRQELKEIFMNSVFGVGLGEKLQQAAGSLNNKRKLEEQEEHAGMAGCEGGSMGVLDMIDSPFSRDLWNLMGWDVFSGDYSSCCM